MSLCPCGSERAFAACCQPLLDGSSQAKTAEQLMRSRYCAFQRRQTDYLVATHHPSQRTPDEAAQVEDWAQATRWLKLEVENTHAGGPLDSEGQVSFTAWFIERGKVFSLHETSRFVREDGNWYYFHGNTQVTSHKTGRNEACPCGSGRKFKQCCLSART